jgi:hypothetical protein
MGGGKTTTVGYWYSFAIHMGASRGPINLLRHIKVGGISAWTGECDTNGDFPIEQQDLFGGETKEGGIQGTFGVYLGQTGQMFSTLFKSLMGGLVPEFRGTTTFTFRGRIAANNPYPKPWEFRIARWDAGWDLDDANPARTGPWYANKARVMLDDGRGGQIFAMNPAHILYECFTNRLWGRGLDPTDLDEDSFVSAANTLCAEGFGLCLKWTRQGDLNEFINSVLNHIGAIRFTDNETGKIGIRLIRADYNPDSLVVFDYNSGLLSIEEDETGGGDSAFSEVIVNYVDAATGEDASTRAQSLALMQSLGDVASTTAAYPGLPTASLAQRVATRDLNQQGAFLKRFKVTLDRRAWKLSRGMVFKITAADRGLVSVILRVGAVEDTDLKDGRINVTAIEDVFGLPETGYTIPELPGAWTPPDNTAFEVGVSRLEETTYREIARNLSPADLATVEDDDGGLAILASPPTGTSINYDLATSATGETMTVRGTGDWTPNALSLDALGHYDTIVSFAASADLSGILPDTAALIDDETVAVLAVDNDTKQITIARGVVDTIPATHSAGARVWFFEDAVGSDDRTYATTEIIDVKLLTRTPSDLLTLDEATASSITMASRQVRPYPPGDLKVNGTPFGDFVTDEEVATGDVVLTWEDRDRVLQADQLVPHEDGSVGPEAGTTYTVRVYDGATLLRTASGITGKTWTYDGTMISSDGEPTEPKWTFRVKSVRDGFDSWQEYVFDVNRRLSRTLDLPAPLSLTLTGRAPEVGASWNLTMGSPTSIVVTGHAPTISF